jgi:hypothetical protein
MMNMQSMVISTVKRLFAQDEEVTMQKFLMRLAVKLQMLSPFRRNNLAQASASRERAIEATHFGAEEEIAGKAGKARRQSTDEENE